MAYEVFYGGDKVGVLNEQDFPAARSSIQAALNYPENALVKLKLQGGEHWFLVTPGASIRFAPQASGRIRQL